MQRFVESTKRRGFTLMELLVVLAILVLLMAMVAPRVLKFLGKSDISVTTSQIGSLKKSLELYAADCRRYPTTEQGLQALVTRPTAGPPAPNWKAYLDKMPIDPWGKPYQYLSPGIKGEIDVFSLGADGQPGGTGVDADIGSWSL